MMHTIDKTLRIGCDEAVTTIQVKLTYNLYNAMPPMCESGGLAIVPAEAAHCEIINLRVMREGKWCDGSWLLTQLSAKFWGDIEQQILEDDYL